MDSVSSRRSQITFDTLFAQPRIKADTYILIINSHSGHRRTHFDEIDIHRWWPIGVSHATSQSIFLNSDDINGLRINRFVTANKRTHVWSMKTNKNNRTNTIATARRARVRSKFTFIHRRKIHSSTHPYRFRPYGRFRFCVLSIFAWTQRNEKNKKNNNNNYPRW